MENDKKVKRPFDSKEFFQKHTAGLVYYPTDKAQKVMIESLEELSMEVPEGGLEYINRLYLNTPPSDLTIDRHTLEENDVKFIGYPEPIQIDLKPALEALAHGDMSPKPVEGLPVVSENGKIPKVYPTGNRDTTTDLNKVLEECDAILTKNGIGLALKEERTPLDVKKLHNELKKLLGDNPIRYTGIGSRHLPIIPLEGLEKKDGMLFAIRKTDPTDVEAPPAIDQDLFDKVKKFRAENPDKVFELDSIPEEYREQIRMEFPDLRPEDIGGEDMVDKILQLPTLDEMMADMNKNGGFRRGEMVLLVAKPRDIYPKTMFGVNTSVPNRPDHPWDPLLIEKDFDKKKE